MVDEVMTYLPGMEGKEKLDLIETLREVTEGKVRSKATRGSMRRSLTL